VLGGVNDVVRHPQGPADDVGRAARQDRNRHLGSRQTVDDLVQRPVAAEGDDHVVAPVERLTPDLGRMVLRLRRHRFDVEAPLQRVHNQVPQPIRHRRRIRVDDEQHPFLRRFAATEGAKLGRHGRWSLMPPRFT
jgi:hypothetical protein